MKRRINNRKKKIILKRIKGILIFLILIGGIFRIKMVDAGINDSKIEKNRVEGVYAVTKLNGEDRIFYLNMYTLNGRPAYCIELGVDIESDIYNSTYDFSVSKLSKLKIDYIRDISYFGYGYPGREDYKYYMAAQALIWEYLNGIEVEWTNELNVNGERINIDKEIFEILHSKNIFNAGARLDGYVNGMNVDIGSNLVMNDKKKSLKYYDVVSGKNINAKINGDQLELIIDTDYVGLDSVILKRKEVYDYDDLLYYQGTSQKLISNGNIDSKIELKFNIKGVDVNFLMVDNSGVKKNNQYSLVGIDYEILNDKGEVVETLLGTETGEISIQNIPYGNYCAKQIRTNEAYKLSDKEYCFEVNKNNEVVSLEVEPIIKELRILKLYGDNDLMGEANAVFDIYNKDGILYDTLITDEIGNGRIVLPYGQYLVRQRSGMFGYYMVDDFELDARGDNEVIERTLVDEKIKVNLVINSKDMDDNLIIDDNIYYRVIDLNDGIYLTVNGEENIKNTNGKIIFPVKVNYGNYKMEAVNKSNKYVVSKRIINFDINNESNFSLIEGELYLEVDFNYELITGKVKVMTYEEKFISKDGSYGYEYDKKDGTSIKIIADEDIVVNGQVIYSKDSVISEGVTDFLGELLIDKMYFGKYLVIDEFGNKEYFEIKNDKLVEVGLKNDLAKGNVNIHNISSELDDIANSVIELYDQDNKLIFTGITNEEGMIKINDLVYGAYCFKQKNVDKQYILNEDKICFSIDNVELVELEIVNKKVLKKLIEIPNTLSNKKSINRIVVLILCVIGGIVYKVKIRNNSK